MNIVISTRDTLIKITKNVIRFQITLTVPACQMHAFMYQMFKNELGIPGTRNINAITVNLTSIPRHKNYHFHWK